MSTRPTRPLRALFCLAIACVASNAGGAQSPTAKISRTLVAVIGSDDDRAAPTDMGPQPQRLSDGSTLVKGSAPSELLVFNSKGRFVRAIGRRGPGPGEFRAVGALHVGAGDTVYVFQPGSIAVFSSTGRYVRTVVTDVVGAMGFTRLGSGDFAISQPSTAKRSTISTVDRSGRPGPRFAVSGSGSCSLCDVRALTPAPQPREFFAVSWERYVVETWSTDGSLVRAVPVVNSWFARDGSSVNRDDGKPGAQVTAISVDADGLLWIGGVVPSDKFVPTPSQGSVAGQRMVRAGPTFEFNVEQYDAIVDVVNPATGALIATARFPGEILSGISKGTLYTQRPSADGGHQLNAWKLQLR